MADVREKLKTLAPQLEVDGEMRAGHALSDKIRNRSGLSSLTGNANLLIMPNLDAANITYSMLKVLASGISVGPILFSTDRPIHAITQNTTPRGIVNLTSLVTASVEQN